MGKRLVLFFSLLALIFCGVSIQSKKNKSVQKHQDLSISDIEKTANESPVSDSLLTWMTDLKNESRANGKTLPVSGNDFPDALVSDGKIETKQG